MRIPTKESLRRALTFFSANEWKVFTAFFVVLFISVVGMLYKINAHFLVSIPVDGGSITEGIIGTPRFVNPVLADSDVDHDITSVVYSGLMKKDVDGNLVPDLAEKYEITPDGLTYTFTLKDNITFHDKQPLTTADVAYTIKQIQDPNINSPEKINWQGVETAIVDAKTITFTLKKPYASFLENTTLGILPAHLWENIKSDEFSFSTLNKNAVGSGPYQVKKVSVDSSGIAIKYSFTSFKKYIFGKPHVKNLNFNFYANENDMVDAYNSGKINQLHSIDSSDAKALEKDGAKVTQIDMGRIFGLFFNANQKAIFTNQNIVHALEHAINKKNIIDQVLNGYGKEIASPVPQALSHDTDAESTYDVELAKSMLAKEGWVPGEGGMLVKKTVTKTSSKDAKGKKTVTTSSSSSQALAFTITTGDAPELEQTVKLIQADLQAIGVAVDIKFYESGKLNQDIIKNRNFDALFFGQIINKESDLYAYWHSSERKDPGLNIAQYTNPDADKLLESSLSTLDADARVQKYQSFESLFAKDGAAIFVYSPKFIYVVKDKLENGLPSYVTKASERFSDVNAWYIETDKVWTVFTRN